MVLDKIQQYNDIKNLTQDELMILRREIRQFLIEKLSVTGAIGIKSGRGRVDHGAAFGL